MTLTRTESDPAADRAEASEDAEPDEILRAAQPQRRAGWQVAAVVGVTEQLDDDGDAGEKECQAYA